MLREAEPRRPAPEDLALLAEVRATIAPDDSALVTWFENYAREHAARLAGDLCLLRQNVESGAEVLECGALPLLMTAALARRGYAVRAVDLAPERFGGAIDRLGLDVVACDIETERLPYDDESFDAVLFNEIFEHLRIDPIFTLGEVRRVLRPGGLLMLSTPNLRSLRGLRNLVFRNQAFAASSGVYRQYAKLRELGHMGHVREYTTREVVDFLERVGLRVEKLVYRGGHGRGVVGLAERAAPSLRPFFAAFARRAAVPGSASG